jgi:hypothetical protein
MKDSSPRVLVIAHSSQMMCELVSALRNSGCAVEWVQDVGAGILRLWQGGFKGIVVGPLIAAADRRLLLVEAPRRNRRIKKINLYSVPNLPDLGSDLSISIDTECISFVEEIKKAIDSSE